MHASLIVESGEPREVHHFAALLGYGANAIHPWLALASIADGLAEGGRHTEGISLEEAQHNFVKAVEKGVLKIMSKMGIATLDSYCGAQVFDAVGISDELIQAAFAGTENFKLGGITYENLARDVLAWHRNGYPKASEPEAEPKLDSYGFYKARRGGEQHAFSPEVVRALHEVVGLGKGSGDQERVRSGAGRRGGQYAIRATQYAPRHSPPPIAPTPTSSRSARRSSCAICWTLPSTTGSLCRWLKSSRSRRSCGGSPARRCRTAR